MGEKPSPIPEIRSLRDLTGQQWRSGLAAWLGWLFDGLDMHLYTLVAARFVAQLRPLLDRAGVGTHLFVGDQRHRRDRVGAVARLAAALQNRRDVHGEGLRGARHRRERQDSGHGKGSQQHAEL